MRRLFVSIALVLALTGCSASTNYTFYPEQYPNGDPIAVECGTVTMEHNGGGATDSTEYVPIGRFCRQEGTR